MACKFSYFDDNSYAAKWDRRLLELLFAEGTLVSDQFSDPLKVQEKGTPDMSVDVLGGDCIVKGDFVADYGKGIFNSDGTVNLSISPSDPALDRIDIVIARLYEATPDYCQLEVVTGTAAGSPTPPATPNNSYLLAEVAVDAAVTTITNADITDEREIAKLANTVVNAPARDDDLAPYVETDAAQNQTYIADTWKDIPNTTSANFVAVGNKLDVTAFASLKPKINAGYGFIRIELYNVTTPGSVYSVENCLETICAINTYARLTTGKRFSLTPGQTYNLRLEAKFSAVQNGAGADASGLVIMGEQKNT